MHRRSRIPTIALILSLAIHLSLAITALFVSVVEKYPETEDDYQMVAFLPEEQQPRFIKRMQAPPRYYSPEKSTESLAERSFEFRTMDMSMERSEPLQTERVSAPEAEPLRLEATQTQLIGLSASDISLSGTQSGVESTNGTNGSGRTQRAGQPTPQNGDRNGLSIAAGLDSSALLDMPTPTLKSPLELIAESLTTAERTSPRVDVVFVLDISQSMQDNIYAVAKQLEQMADHFQDHQMDYEIGIILFHHSTWSSLTSSSLEITDLTRDVERIRKILRKVKTSGGEKAMNALYDSAERFKFRDGSSRHFVFVTDEYADGDYSSREVFGALHRKGIRVDVIGLDEPFQRALAARTGGIWIPIANLSS
ncbi:MAG: VWA domain-containing protein [Candidatus Poribacteria bacterium]|nr:VWA domain-containing protein [Candidatus Poribacteria bacterium]